jgi:CRP/FNR family transcriptional regulator
MHTDIVKLFPTLKPLEQALAALQERAPALSVAAGTQLFAQGAPCLGFPLVLEGEIRVACRSEDGRSLELYRVRPGDLCLVSSASLFSGLPLGAQGESTQASTLLMIPPAVFEQWLGTPAFRNLVLGLFAERMAELTSLIDAVAFQKLDQRLAAALLGRGQNLRLSHQTLANELGTVREMVTRLLRRFEREGWITLGREHIQLHNSVALRAIASGTHPVV